MESTREEAKNLAHDETVAALNQLLEKNYDAEQGYKNALVDAKNPSLKSYFTRQAANRSQYVNELDKAIRDLNADPIEKGSTTGSLHRTWMDIKTAIVGKDDEAVLEECIRGDKAAVEEYKEVLNNQEYLHGAADVVRNQLNGILNTLDTIKKLEDIVD
jgi:uncharacterized protein (TIGR02284 family)